MSGGVAVWEALRAEVAAGRDVVLAVVVDSEGHSPGRAGFVMAVGRAGWLAGTTGGGAAEAAVVERALALLDGGHTSALLTQTPDDSAATPSGLICGGEQRVALVRMPAGLDLSGVVEALRSGDTVAWSAGPDGWTAGGTDGGIGGGAADGFAGDAGRWRFSWTSGPRRHAYLVGAGHVGGALARTLVPLGFRVTVVDERPGAAARLAGTAHAAVERPYEKLAGIVAPGRDCCVLVATHAPARDQAALDAVAGLELGYVGVLGSPAKLRRIGVPGRVHAPMGLPIGSHTPEEIAVSVAAEVLQVLRRHPAHPAHPADPAD